jgi:hypothetical protein
MLKTGLQRLGTYATTTASKYARQSGTPQYYMRLQTARYHVSATEVRRQEDVRSQVQTLVQQPYAQQQYFLAPDLSAHGRAHPTEIVRALTLAGIPQTSITMIWAVAQAVGSSMGTMAEFLSEFTDLRGVLVVRGSTKADASAVLAEASGSALAPADSGAARYTEACRIVKATNHKLALVLNPYVPYPTFLQQMKLKLSMDPEFLFTQPVFDPYCMNPQVRAYIEWLALEQRVRLAVGVINATPNLVKSRMQGDSDARVQPSGLDRYIMPDMGEDLETTNRRNVEKTLAWVSERLRGGPDSVYVRDQTHNRNIFSYLEGTEFDCKVVKKPGVPLLKQ